MEEYNKEIIPAMKIKIKQCKRKKCLQFKPITEFYNSSVSKDGHHSYCKDCHRIIGIERNEERKKKNKQLAFIGDEKNKKRHNRYLREAKQIYGVEESQLKQCHREECMKFKPLNEFSPSLSSPDGYSLFCSACLFLQNLRDEIRIELSKNKNDYNGKSIIQSFQLENFLSLKLIHCPHPPISEYFLGSKTKNNYILPDDVEFMEDEYCHGEPPSSFKDFIRLAEPDTSYQKEIKTILENWNVLSEVS